MDNNNTERSVDLILDDFTVDDIKGKFDFMFHQVLETSEGMAGPDLAEMFELLNRTSDMYKCRELERG